MRGCLASKNSFFIPIETQLSVSGTSAATYKLMEPHCSRLNLHDTSSEDSDSSALALLHIVGQLWHDCPDPLLHHGGVVVGVGMSDLTVAGTFGVAVDRRRRRRRRRSGCQLWLQLNFLPGTSSIKHDSPLYDWGSVKVALVI